MESMVLTQVKGKIYFHSLMFILGEVWVKWFTFWVCGFGGHLFKPDFPHKLDLLAVHPVCSHLNQIFFSSAKIILILTFIIHLISYPEWKWLAQRSLVKLSLYCICIVSEIKSRMSLKRSGVMRWMMEYCYIYQAFTVFLMDSTDLNYYLVSG